MFQIEKGPVDYITGNARYALHEKNLLSKITDFTKLNVMVYLEDDPYLKDTPYTPLKSCQVSNTASSRFTGCIRSISRY